MERQGFSGMQPSLSVRGDLIACKLIDGPEGSVITKGEWHDVRIDLAYGEGYSHDLRSGFRFNLNVGNKVIGEGAIL